MSKSRSIIFYKQFPRDHIRNGQSTFLVQNVQNSLNLLELKDMQDACKNYVYLHPIKQVLLDRGIGQTRNNFKVGDKFIPHAWLGSPCKSSLLPIAHDLEVKQVWEVEIDFVGENERIMLNGKVLSKHSITVFAHRCGLRLEDFKSWYCKPFVKRFLLVSWFDEKELHYNN